MSLPTNFDQLRRTSYTEIDGQTCVRTSMVTVAGNVNVNVPSGATVTVSNALLTGTNYIGNVTNTQANAIPTGNNWIGLVSTASVQGKVELTAGNAQIGSASVFFQSGATVSVGNNLTFGSNVTLNASNAYIGLATVNIGSGNKITWDSGATVAVSNLPAVTWTSGATVSVGNPLPTGSNFIGLISTASIRGEVKLVAGTAYAGCASVNVGGTLPALSTGGSWIGMATIISGATLFCQVNTTAAGSSTVYQGTTPWLSLTTAVIGSAPTLYAVVNTSQSGQASVILGPGVDWIGMATTTQANAIPVGTNWIGLATVTIGAGGGTSTIYQGSTPWQSLATVTIGSMATVTLGTRLDYSTDLVTNYVGGSNKTLITLPIVNNNAGSATIFVPTAKFYVTNMMIGANASCMVNILSGATYLLGNASIGMGINQTGGFVYTGSVDSPIFAGMASGAAFVVKSNATAGLAGTVTYFEA